MSKPFFIRRHLVGTPVAALAGAVNWATCCHSDRDGVQQASWGCRLSPAGLRLGDVSQSKSAAVLGHPLEAVLALPKDLGDFI